jgi:hypothetical protein
MNEATANISRPLIFNPRDWEQLTPAFGRLKSMVGANGPKLIANSYTATYFDRCVHEGLLELALVAPDLTYRLFDAAERRKLTIRVPLNYEEGCSIEPYHEGRWYVRRSGLEKLETEQQCDGAPISKLDAWVAKHGPTLEGNRPKEGWNKFYDRCRDDCGGWADKKNGKRAADFSNKTIERRLQHAGFKPKPNK